MTPKKPQQDNVKAAQIDKIVGLFQAILDRYMHNHWKHKDVLMKRLMPVLNDINDDYDWANAFFDNMKPDHQKDFLRHNTGTAFGGSVYHIEAKGMKESIAIEEFVQTLYPAYNDQQTCFFS
jgi:hypothetical protein